MLTWLLVIALLWPAFWLLRMALVLRMLMAIEFRAEKIVPFSVEQTPPHLAEAAGPWLARLRELGFRELGGWHVRRFLDPALDHEAVVLTHGSLPMRAVVQPYELAARSGECWVSLRTTTASGFEIVTSTFAPEEIVARPAGLDVEVVDTDALPDLLGRHHVRIMTHEASAWRCADLAGAALREQYVCDAVFAQQRAQGDFTEQPDGSLSYRIGPACRRAACLLRTAKGQLKKEKDRVAAAASTAPTLSEEAQTTFDLQHYRQMVALTRGRLSARAKTIVTVVSFIVFAAVLAWTMSPVIAATLLVSLVIHEGGHLLGMRWFGYRDTQLLFIPFFGGAAIGHDDKVLRPWQHIVIILLGPLPGIFLGLGLGVMASGGPEWLQQAALTMVVMNAFNLLPILPLDGGQIVDYAVAARFPRARVLFLAFSAAALLLVALALDGLVVLAVVAGFMLLRLPAEWKLARLRHDVRQEYPDGGDEEPVIRRLLTRFRGPEWRKVSMTHRLVNTQALQHVLRIPRPGFGTIAFALLGYTAPLWGGVPLAVWIAHREGEKVVAQAEEKVRAAGLRRLPTAAAAAPAEENGAVLFARAEALSKARAKRGAAEVDAELVALLREAAHKPVFLPLAASAAPVERKWSEFLGRGRLNRTLADAAQEKLRFGEPKAAATLVVDALRLARLMDATPGAITWTAHEQAVSSSLDTLEEILATGASLSPEVIAQLRALTDERHEVAFAARELPHELLGEARMMDEMQTEADTSVWLQMWVVLGNLVTDAARTKANLMEQAIALKGQMKEIQAGKWPAPVKSDSFSREDMIVAQLADLLARLKQARVALIVAEQRIRGIALPSLEAVGVPLAELQHPLTLEPIRWVRRGSIDVLAFAPARSRLTGLTDADATPEVIWRLPGEAERR